MSRKKELEIKGKGKGWENPHFTQECQLTARLEQDISVNTQTNTHPHSPLTLTSIPIPPGAFQCNSQTGSLSKWKCFNLSRSPGAAVALQLELHSSRRRHRDYGWAKISPALEESFPLVQLQPLREAQAGVSRLHWHVLVPHSARTSFVAQTLTP